MPEREPRRGLMIFPNYCLAQGLLVSFFEVKVPGWMKGMSKDWTGWIATMQTERLARPDPLRAEVDIGTKEHAPSGQAARPPPLPPGDGPPRARRAPSSPPPATGGPAHPPPPPPPSAQARP